MGVPAFFRWLSRKYPSVIVDCTENKTTDEDGRTVLEDATLPNPNGVEFDNLYLDMNGIIHPCTHPEDKPAPKNEDEMMVAIYECIDRIMGIVRPRKVLYMAIDGVAPRAKMNQQRSRRFRAAKESVEKRAQIARIREELLSRGCILPPEKPKEEHFDSNCITPGTPFMERLSHCLHYYIHDRMNNNPAWKNIKVILSDANVPGEGEHKIMDYIRRQRAQPDHDPNTQHVLCGADADLIMLGLATHEPNFTIIREEFLPNKPKPCEMCNQFGHELDKCQGLNAVDVNSSLKPDIPVSAEVQFIFVRLSVLREYLKRTLAMPNLPFEYDFDRALDDWVFMCFFVGNDFLPHLPSLEIREGAVDRLVELYKKCVYKTGGYLTDSGEVNLERVQIILDDLGMVEDHIFKERQRKEEQFKARDKAKRRRMEFVRPDFRELHKSNFGPVPLGRNQGPSAIENPRQEIARLRMQQGERNASSSSDSKELESLIRPDNSNQRGTKRKASEMDGETNKEEEEEDYQNNDEVRLWEDGFKDRYYESKFDVGSDNLNFRDSVALQYVRGLCWVLKYYYQGCTSWKWYFPYHYAPFASDFVNISGLSTAFEKGTKPFNPLEQLMGVFPAASSSHVPKPWADLMSNPNSPIIDFYPEDFKIDLNGKKFAWQGVALLPFVEESRLFKALEPYYGKLTQAEITRNLCGDNRLYIASQNVGYKTLKALYKNEIDPDQEVAISIEGLQGSILLANENVGINKSLPSPIMGLNEIEENEVITVRFRDPKYSDDFIFPAKRLPKAVDPPTVLPTGGNEQGNHRPVISFNTNLPSANLGAAGHRMLNHYNRPNNDQGGNRNPYNNYGRGGGGGNSNNHNNNGRGSGGGGANNYNNNGRGGGGGGGANNYNNNGRGGNWTQGNASRNYNSGGGGGRGEYQSNNYNQRGGRGGSYSNNNRFGNNNNYRQGNNNGNNGSEGGRGGGGGGYRRYNN